MINNIVFYGSVKDLISLEIPTSEGLSQIGFMENCFGVNFYAYATELFESNEQLTILKNKFNAGVGGGNLVHETFREELEIIVSTWMNNIKLKGNDLLSSLGINIKRREGGLLDKLAIQEASRRIITENNPWDKIYIVDASKYNVNKLPPLLEISNELTSDFKERRKMGFKTVGGGEYEVNPINSSTIVYTDSMYDIIIGDAHALKQFMKEGTLKQVLSNVFFIRSTLTGNYTDIYQTLSTHLGIQLKYLTGNN
jgi:hypothetical protein